VQQMILLCLHIHVKKVFKYECSIYTFQILCMRLGLVAAANALLLRTHKSCVNVSSVLGNHDYRGNATAQLAKELTLRDSRWFCSTTFQLKHDLGLSDQGSNGRLVRLLYLWPWKWKNIFNLVWSKFSLFFLLLGCCGHLSSVSKVSAWLKRKSGVLFAFCLQPAYVSLSHKLHRGRLAVQVANTSELCNMIVLILVCSQGKLPVWSFSSLTPTHLWNLTGWRTIRIIYGSYQSLVKII
jgi:hypothetical protein